ncbi:MAG: DUF4412 domain-containing protein, partial [Granulosicoccus sp.]|nr:DUF4412 domain-containing protein [Granulosicoccus sp.]
SFYSNFVALVAVLGIFSPAFADITLDYSNPQKASENMTLTVVNDKAAVQFKDEVGGNTRMVFNKADNKLYMVMDDRKQYMDMDAMMKTMGDLSGMLSGMMKDLPADAQGQLGDLLGGLMGGNKEEPAPAPDPVLKETGETEEIAGFQCALATLQSQDQTTELCLAQPSKVGISDADFAVMQAMLLKQKEAVEKASDMIGMQDIGFNPGDIDRMPLRISQISGAGAGSVSELRAVREQADTSAVVIPDDYAPMQMPGIQ